MNNDLAPGPAASQADLRTAQERHRLLGTELPRVRAAATAWRNALGALLLALVGFSLVKGRTDIGDLAHMWAVFVGVLLLAAIILGATGALSLIRAANGRPSVAPIHELLPRSAADHVEALESAAALRRGIWLTMTCAAFLIAAVATTWYGPGRSMPFLQVTTPNQTACGSVVRLNQGFLVLKSNGGEVTIDLREASTVRPVTACPSS